MLTSNARLPALPSGATSAEVSTSSSALGSFGEYSLKCLTAASTLNSELNCLSLTFPKPWTYILQS